MSRGICMLTVLKADLKDSKEIHKMQIESFKGLLDKYNDIATNPGAETIEQIINRMNTESSQYYLIQVENENIGAFRIVRLTESTCRIAPIFLVVKFQDNGFGKMTMMEIEKLYPHINCWQLETIKEEPQLCYFYEGLGYNKTGEVQIINDKMTIIHYSKQVKTLLR